MNCFYLPQNYTHTRKDQKKEIPNKQSTKKAITKHTNNNNREIWKEAAKQCTEDYGANC